MPEATKVGKRGTVVIPAPLRKQFGMTDGSLVLMEAAGEGVLIRPAVAIPLESYSPTRKAAFLLENAVDASDYRRAAKAVRNMGLDPKKIPHRRP